METLVPVDTRTAARAALKTLTVRQLERGLRAFPRRPYIEREAVGACFVGWAYSRSEQPDQLEFNKTFTREAPVDSATYDNVGHTLSTAYEMQAEWFYGEVIRELAERGVAVEPALATA